MAQTGDLILGCMKWKASSEGKRGFIACYRIGNKGPINAGRKSNGWKLASQVRSKVQTSD